MRTISRSRSSSRGGATGAFTAGTCFVAHRALASGRRSRAQPDRKVVADDIPHRYLPDVPALERQLWNGLPDVVEEFVDLDLSIAVAAFVCCPLQPLQQCVG